MSPVQGGAVETLVQDIIDENEKQQRLEITVLTKNNAQARALYSDYKHTKFVPIDVSRLEEKLAWLFRGGMNMIFRRPFTPGLAYLMHLCMTMRGKKFDRVVVETQGPFVPALFRLHPGAIDLHVHNMVPIENEMQRPERVAQQCSRVIGVSCFINGWAQQSFGVLQEKCRVLLNCVDVDAFRAARSQRDDMRRKLNIGEDEILLLFIERLCEAKGALELSQAFVRAGLLNTKLVFAGSRWFSDNQKDAYHRRMQDAPRRMRMSGTAFQWSVGRNMRVYYDHFVALMEG